MLVFSDFANIYFHHAEKKREGGFNVRKSCNLYYNIKHITF